MFGYNNTASALREDENDNDDGKSSLSIEFGIYLGIASLLMLICAFGAYVCWKRRENANQKGRMEAYQEMTEAEMSLHSGDDNNGQ